jgi:DUF4097 and DUF4098 domain-containing protein YvlB
MKKLLFSLTCLLVLNYSSQAQEDNYSFKESFKISEPAQLVISSDDGNIEVMPSDQNNIEVHYIVKRNNKLLTISRAELEKEVTLETTSSVNRLTIGVKYPKILHLPQANNHITVSLKIHVPKQTACNLNTSDGNISVTGLISDQVIKTSDGNILVSNIKGSVRGNTSDGNILIKEIRGSVDLKSGDGHISLEDIVGNTSSSTGDGNMKAIRIRGDLSLKTSDGHIEFEGIEGSVTAITSDRHIRGNVIELQKKLSLETGDGNIEVAVPDRLGLNLNIRGSSIHTPLKIFSGESGQHSIQGKLNGGGIPVELKASEGNIKLSYR